MPATIADSATDYYHARCCSSDDRVPTTMVQHDYNGPGRWSRKAIQGRYDELARQLRVAEPCDLRPMEVASGDSHWVYPVMHRVIDGIVRGNAACIELGVELIQEDRPLPFGRSLKSNTARALRRAEAELTPSQKERIRKRVIGMLIAGNTPREYREYAKLVRRIGVGDWWAQSHGLVNTNIPHVRRYYDYFRQYVVGREARGVEPGAAPNQGVK